MKSIKFALATFVGAALLVGTFAFSSKPMTVVTYRYFPATANKDVRTSTSGNAIIATELTDDSAPLVNGSLDNWSALTIPSHTSGERLLGIEFDNTVVANIEAAGAQVKSTYQSTGTLPNDGQSASNIKYFIQL